MTKQHISFSELKTWAECPFKHKLKYIDGISGFTGNAFTAFGTAIHDVCEHIAKEELAPEEYDNHFDLAFLCELKKLDDKPDNQLIVQMRQQGKAISPSVFPQLKEHFDLINNSTFIQNVNRGNAIDHSRYLLSQKQDHFKKIKSDIKGDIAHSEISRLN